MTTSDLVMLDTVVSMPLMKLPMRTVVVPLGTARVMLSPGSRLTPESLRDAGALTDIVATTLFHLDGAKAAAAAHPQARLWGPPGCREKRPDVAWQSILGEEPWPHDDELVHIPVSGLPKVNESVFLHKASRTLLVSDLVFNVIDSKGAGAWLVLSVFGTYRRLGVSRLFLKLVADRHAFERSLAQIASLDFDAIVPSHGHVVAARGKELLLAAFRQRGLKV